MRQRLAALTAVAVAALLVSESLCQRKATPVYVGCFKDQAPPNRDLLGLVGIAQLGPFSVSEICTYGGFRYVALQSPTYCTCDSSYGSEGPAPESNCNRRCAGNASQMCGGPYRNSIYDNVRSSSSNGLRFRKVAASAAPPLVTAAEFAGSLGWDRTAHNLMECAGSCARAASCSVYRLNSSSGLGRLPQQLRHRLRQRNWRCLDCRLKPPRRP